MEVGQGQNWGCSAKGKKKIRCTAHSLLLQLMEFTFFFKTNPAPLHDLNKETESYYKYAEKHIEIYN
jgi:hypothetical protein